MASSRAEKLELFGAERFVLTDEHVKLLRAAVLSWQDVEAGAPAIDPKRPYGNGDVVGDIHEILTGGPFAEDERPSTSSSSSDRYRELHRETETALQVILSSGSFEPGVYETPKYHPLWERIVADFDGHLPTCDERGGTPFCDTRCPHYSEHPWKEKTPA